MQVYCIEGLIGAGKTTMMDALKEKVKKFNKSKGGIHFIYEPVEMWEKQFRTGKKGMLQLFYENPERYAFMMEVGVISSIASEMRKAIKKGAKIVIMERSLFSAFNVFTKMLYDDKKMERSEYKILEQHYNSLREILPTPHFVHLKVEPEVALERIKKRGRKAEQDIKLLYLEDLQKYTVKWLNTVKNVLEIDVSEDEFNNAWVDEIMNKLNASEFHEKDFIITFD